MSPAPPRVHPVGWVVLVAAAVFTLTLPRGPMLDATVRYDDMRRVLDGRKTEQKFSMVGPLCAAPLYYLGERLGDPERWVWYFNRLVVLAACVGLWWLFRPILSAPERVRFTVALLLTSTLPHHLMQFGGEVFTCVTSACGLAAVALRRAWWGVPLAVLGAVNLPGMIGALGTASVVLVFRTRRFRFLAAAPLAFGLWMLENYLRRGDPWNTGYDGEHGVQTALPYSAVKEFGHPLFFGLLSVLLSFGKGLIYFMPALFLPLPADASRPGNAEEALRWVYRVWVGYMVGVVVVYSKWWCWSGGWYWGPRFFLFGCFVAALVVARRTATAERAGTFTNLLVLAALALSAWVTVGGVVYELKGVLRYVEDGPALEHLIWHVPECSTLWWPLVTPIPLEPQDWLRIAAVVAAFCYLAAPVVATLLRRAPGYLEAAWRAVRSGPAFRI